MSRGGATADSSSQTGRESAEEKPKVAGVDRAFFSRLVGYTGG
jgi:hypothetical protein